MLRREQDINRLADEELMLLIRQSDEQAFEALYDRHSGPAFSLAYRMTGARGAAEDIVQEGFLSVWRSSGLYAPERGSVRSWILGIVHNRGVDSLRRNLVSQRRQAAAEELEERREETDRTEVEAGRREEARRIRDALAALPEDQGRVIELAYFGGFTQSEISEMLAMPLGTVKGRMRLGLDKLRRSLGEMAA